MEKAWKAHLESKFKQVREVEEDPTNSVFSFKSEGSFLIYEFKPDWFKTDNFENFCIFQSTWKLTIPELYPYKDPKFKEVYQEVIPRGLGEILVITNEDSREYRLRTVIHCLEENYIEMINELEEMHRKVHEEVKAKMNQSHKI